MDLLPNEIQRVGLVADHSLAGMDHLACQTRVARITQGLDNSDNVELALVADRELGTLQMKCGSTMFLTL